MCIVGRFSPGKSLCTNPLSVDPTTLSYREDLGHLSAVRQEWDPGGTEQPRFWLPNERVYTGQCVTKNSGGVALNRGPTHANFHYTDELICSTPSQSGGGS